MDYFVREEVLLGRAVPHGGLLYGRLKEEGVPPEEVLDFSASTNPFPPCPKVLEAAAGAALLRYPDSSSGELREEIARLHGVSAEGVLVVNGLAQGIFLTAFAFADRGKTVLTASPTFGEYRSASELAGAMVLEVSAAEGNAFAFPMEGLEGAAKALSPSLLWVCSPNNPTGILPSPEQLQRLMALCEQKGTVLVLDEAYINFAPPGASAVDLLRPGLLILRSMTKDYGLTGLRLGYVLGDPAFIRILAALQPPWSVNACAQAAGAAALKNKAYYEGQWRELEKIKGEFAKGLESLGLAPLPSAANFLLFRAGDVEALQDFLWEKRILVRNCASFGLKGYVRVGVKTREENGRLLKGLEEYREGAGPWGG